jgi:hypothetical protein
MMSEHAEALRLISAARSAAEEELSRHRAGRRTVGSLAQLQLICESLADMERDVEHSTVPPASARDRGMGRMIVDGWPLSSSLGSLVLCAEQAFLRL